MITAVTHELRYAADIVLRQPSLIGVRTFETFLIQNTWTNCTRPNGPGGIKTQTITPLYNGGDGYLHCVQVSAQDIALSGGRLKDRDWVLGPIVFPYVATFGSGGTDLSVFQPVNTGNPIESFIWIKGPGLPVDGSYFKKIYDVSDRSIMYRVYLRDIGIQSP